jgi:hypothetical protein
VNSNSGKRTPPPADRDEEPGRDINQPRRVGRIVHDDRGVASVEWRDAPPDYDRPVFEIEQTASRSDARLRGGFELALEVKQDASCNPYDRQGGTFVGRSPAPDTTSKSGKRDLRKLSEWMKLMKAMEERKKGGEE